MSGARRLVVVGGGPAGLAAARAYRDAGGDGDVTLLTPEPHAPYERPPLSKEFLRAEAEAGELALEDAAWYAEHDVVVRLATPAERLDPERRTVAPRGGQPLDYDACVLATGSTPLPLPVPGGDHPDVLLLRSLESALGLRRRAEAAERAVVIGAGFIGCEVAASLAMRGARVTLVAREALPQGPRLGEDAGRRIAGWLRAMGVELVLEAEVEAIAEDGRAVRVDGRLLRGDLVLVGGGVKPNAQLAAEAGLTVREGRVATDAGMRASAPGVLAAGDVAFAENASAGRALAVEHWGEALNMGEVAGRVAAGVQDARWEVAPGFWSTIGAHTMKYVAWGDGFDTARLEAHDDGAFTVWYARDGILVGALCHERDADYERARELIEAKAPVP